ncbi:MAG: MFS transporter [Oscillospiraceae bacterium]|nr:MFS transporter [Oscillospiraceae bacterium]
MARSNTADKQLKLNYPKTILTGFGFLASSIAWAIYDPYITKILNKFLTESPTVAAWSERLAGVGLLERFMATQGESLVSAGRFTLVPLFIGIIMTFDNIFGVIFQPTFGKLSDRCHSRLGKRRPFILFGAPVSAFLFALIPLMGTLPGVMLCVILFVFVMSLWRAPVVALMPDLTPPALRSDGNAVINVMGGLGSILGYFAGTLVSSIYIRVRGIPAGQLNEFDTFPWIFLLAAVIMVACTVVVMLFVKEKDSRLLSADVLASRNEAERREAEKKAKAEEKRARKAMVLSKAERRSLIFMLAGLFFLFCASNAIQTFFSLFAEEILHINTASATILLSLFGVCGVAAAIPAGKLGRRFGRKKTILAGLSLFLASFVVFFAIFISMNAAKGLSIKEYTAVNDAYSSLAKEVLDYNNEAGTELSVIEYVRLQVDNEAHYREDFRHYDNLYREVFHNFETDGPIGDYDPVRAVEAIEEAVSATTRVLDKLIYPVMVIAGCASMMITVNTLPLVLEIGGIQRVGTFTGYYYTATFSAQIASPIAYGFFRMLSGSYISLFYYSPVAFVLALAAIVFVRHGEAIPQEVIKEAEEID